MDAVLAWLSGLPPAALYLTLAVVAALESVFPPLPSDTVVAFGSFLAARGQGTLLGTFLATWIGSVGGAIAVYWVGRRYAAGEMRKRLLRYGGERAERRVELLYKRRGLLAIFLSRFLPGARAIVPPFAGALRLPAAPVAVAIGSASAIWYGLITFAAYRVGADWEALRAHLTTLSRGTAIFAVVAVVLIAGGVLIARAIRRGRAPR
jgi:membrane protein DedA with SNARE-associated domain